MLEHLEDIVVYNTFYIRVLSKNNGATNLLCDYRVTRECNWAIIEFQGDIEHNQILYKNFIEDIRKKNPAADIIVKQPSGEIIIEYPTNMYLAAELVGYDFETFEQKFKEIETHIK